MSESKQFKSGDESEEELYFEPLSVSGVPIVATWDRGEKSRLSEVINKIRKSLQKAKISECSATLEGNIGVIKATVTVKITSE